MKYKKQKRKYKKHDATIRPQVISLKTFYTSKRASFLLFLNILPHGTRRI